jgi:glycyl-tRNA synthetase
MNTQEIATFCKEGFLAQSSEIYNGFSGFYDYMHFGTLMKNNLKSEYIRYFVQMRDDIVLQDATIISHPDVWEASGHRANFSDPILTTEKTKTKLRADHFIEEALNIPTDGLTIPEMNKIIEDNKLTYKGEKFLTMEPYNLMFSTQVGALQNNEAFLRPETAQAIFVNFKHHAATMQLPFGVAQIGKAFRNEISPRDFLFRLREFEQAEMEYFYNPEVDCPLVEESWMTFDFLPAGSTEMVKATAYEICQQKRCNLYHAYFLNLFYRWMVEQMGLKNLRVREHLQSELSHYSSATFDIDYRFVFGYKEIFGVADRGCFDLSQHQKHSKKNLEVFDAKTNKKVLPYVIEPSLGIDRMMMALFAQHLETIKTEKLSRTVFHCPTKLAPYQVCVLPLVIKDGLGAYAQQLYKKLKMTLRLSVTYEPSGAISKRYFYQDKIGTAYCLTIDYQSLSDNTVTLRNREDPLNTQRVSVDDVEQILWKLYNQ